MSIDKDGWKSCVHTGRIILVIKFMDDGSVNITPTNSIKDPTHGLESSKMI